jgi:hypothetical protein
MAGTDEVERIARGLIDRTLPKAQWNHRAHFAAALWLLEHPDVLARSGGMGPIIRAYNESTGVTNTGTSGYHETITQASLRGAAAVRAESPGEPLGRVIDTLMAGELGDKRWPFAYWSEARLMSVDARRHWVEPDLAPLPW